MISAIHHAALRVTNLTEAMTRWSHIIGLTGEQVGQRALLRCAYEDFAILLEESQAKPGLEYVAYELTPGITLSEAAQHLATQGVAIQEIEIPGRDKGLRLADPDGNGIVLLERRRREDTRNPEVRFNASLPAFHPRKFGHVNYLTSNTAQIVAWYTTVLGFLETDWIGDEGCWLHVNADHHVLAFLNKGYTHIHHLAFELVDWGEMRVALDHLAQNQRHLVWGPGRHGNARNLYSYFRMPEEELFIEFFCDLEQLLPDHQVRHLPDNAHSSNTWGILPPRSYFRFDTEALRMEEAQAEAYGQSGEAATIV